MCLDLQHPCLFLPLQHLQVMNAKVATAHECKGRNWHGCCNHYHTKVRGGNISRHSSEWWHWHHSMSTVKVIDHVSAGLSGCLCRSNSSGHSFCSMPSSFYCPPAWFQMPCLASITPHAWSVYPHVQEQQLRSQALQPFIVAPPSRGIVGTSRFAQRMKAQVMQAAKDPTR